MSPANEAPPEKKSSGIVDLVLGAVKLDWLRPLIHKVGGRKTVFVGAALAVIDRIVGVAGESFGWPHGIACLSVALVAGLGAFSVAHEKKGNKPDPNPVVNV